MSNSAMIATPYKEMVGSGMFSVEGVDSLVSEAIKTVLEAMEKANDHIEVELETDGSVLDKMTILGCWC